MNSKVVVLSSVPANRDTLGPRTHTNLRIPPSTHTAASRLPRLPSAQAFLAMALRMASIPSNAAPACSLSLDSQTPFASFSCRKDLALKLFALDCSRSLVGSSKRRDGSFSITVARAVEQAASTSVGGVAEVTQETFWPVLEAAGDKIVVVDLYTQWCGPCKIMYPKIVELSKKYADVVFLKLDCNQDNKVLAKKLGVKVVPTFKLFRNRQEVAEIKGAKFDELVQRIEEARAS